MDPLISWSRYLDQLAPWFERELEPGWTARVRDLLKLLKQGEAVQQMMEVTGEEGVTLEDYLTWQKAQCLDQVYLQQDAFDPVDVSTPILRQQALLALLADCLSQLPPLSDKAQARDYFISLTGLLRNLNYSRQDSPDYRDYLGQIEQLRKGG